MSGVEPIGPDTGIGPIEGPSMFLPTERDLIPEIRVSKYPRVALDTKGVARISPEIFTKQQMEHIGLGVNALQTLSDDTENLNIDEWSNLKVYIDQQGDLYLDKILLEKERVQQLTTFLAEILAIPTTPIAIATGHVAPPVAIFIENMDLQDLSARLYDYAEVIGAVAKVPSVALNGAKLILVKRVLEAAQEKLNELKEQQKVSPNKTLQENISNLEFWINTQVKSSAIELKGYLLGGGNLTRLLLQHTVDFVKPELLGAIPSVTFDVLGLGLVSIGGVLGTGSAAYAAHRRRREVKLYDEMEKRDKVASPEAIERTIPSVWKGKIDPAEKKQAVDKIDRLLEKRKEIYSKRLEEMQNSFETEIKPLIVSDHPPSETLKQLHAKGIFLERLGIIPDETGEKTLALLRKEGLTEKHQEAIIHQYTDFKDTIAISTRNAIKTLKAKKSDFERKFMHFKKTKAYATVVVTALACSAIIAIKVLAYSGILAVSLGMLLTPVIGAAVFGFGMIAMGLFILYKKKPNVFRETIQLTQSRMAILAIPYTIKQYRLKTQQVKELNITEKARLLRVQMQQVEGLLKMESGVKVNQLPTEMQKKFKGPEELLTPEQWKHAKEKLSEWNEKMDVRMEEYIIDLKQTQKRINDLDEKLLNTSKQLKKLARKMRDAEIKDFTNLYAEGDSRLDIANRVVEGLLYDTNAIDEETKMIFHKQFEVNLDRLKEERQTDELKKDLIEIMEKMISEDDVQLMHHARKRLKKLKYEEARESLGLP